MSSERGMFVGGAGGGLVALLRRAESSGGVWRCASLRPLVAVVAMLVPAASAAGATRVGPNDGLGAAQHWVGTWTASPSSPYSTGISSTGFANQTIREVLHTSVGGSRTRLRLANTFGSGPLTIDHVGLALPAG